MKITVNQLRRIIKEEVQKVLGAEKPTPEQVKGALETIGLGSEPGDDPTRQVRTAEFVVDRLAKESPLNPERMPIKITADDLINMINSTSFQKIPTEFGTEFSVTEDGKIEFTTY
jgi:hypothetical protein